MDKCNLRCAYHGWSFNKEGTLEDYSHDNFGKPLIKRQLKTYPVQVRYGLIWLFPGNPELATVHTIPVIPELTNDNPWANFVSDLTWKTHHSMVMDNISDFSHAFLHRKYQPFIDAKLTHHEADYVTNIPINELIPETALKIGHSCYPSTKKPLRYSSYFISTP